MLTPCLGRERVHAQLDDALESARWVSVVGPPGSGKTLLVRHLAARSPMSTWVNAQGLLSADAVLSACLHGLGAEAAPGDSTTGALGRALDGSDTLLVVDGVDIDADGLGPALQEILETTSAARLAVTARTMSGQPGERVVRVGPLPVPAPHEPLSGPAVELFRHRVEAAGGYPVDLVEHESVVRRLLTATGGLPLLIEQLAVQIALVGLTNVVPTASLSEAVHASYELLDEDQRRCFRRMAQLTTPVSIEVLAEIVGVDRTRATELATGLSRRSLMEVLPDGRLDMLSPIRRHGAFLTASTDDADRAAEGLIRWADRVAPDDFNYGAADAPWLGDLPVMRAAITAAVADPETRDAGYGLANRIFSSLYTAMRAREAVEILEEVLVSGDGPAAIGAQVARRAGIAASEVRGTYEGLWLLERADEHARGAPHPALERSRTASIRAEMHLDAGALDRAAAEAQRAIDLDADGGLVVAQATRTLTDLHVSRGDFADAQSCAGAITSDTSPTLERWIVLSARTLMARIALEQGRSVEAASAARAAMREARQVAEDRMALLAETVLRQIEPGSPVSDVDRESLPWAVRMPVLAQDARDLFLSGDVPRAAGLAADVVVLADSCRLGRDAVDGRLTLAHALLAQGELDQAATTFLYALEQAAAMPMPLRVADVFDGLASVAERRGQRQGRQLAAVARALRVPRYAVPWGCAALDRVEPARTVPAGWVVDGQATDAAMRAAAAVFAQDHQAPDSPIGLLTKAERQVAERVADGLTSRQIAAELFLSPRTVDAHLGHIYRKLDIGSRAKLAAMVVDLR
ncbi:MAG: LuxR C-terminal-related transcriptional regulator [Nocardioides sp.]